VLLLIQIDDGLAFLTFSLLGDLLKNILLFLLLRRRGGFFLDGQLLLDNERLLVLFLFGLDLHSLNRLVLLILLRDFRRPSLRHFPLALPAVISPPVHLLQLGLHLELIELLGQLGVFLEKFHVLPSLVLQLLLEEVVKILHLVLMVLHHVHDLLVVLPLHGFVLSCFIFALHPHLLRLVIIEFLVALHHTFVLLTDAV
jgi:hypothetical protein